MLLSLLTVPLALLVSTVSGYANPLSCSGVCNNGHDPALIRRASDGKYFRFATAGGIQIHTASSIQGPWTFAGQALVGGSKIDNSGKNDLWAPDVTLVGNTYYLYYSVSSFGTQDSVIGLATSTTLEPGSWTDQGTTGISSSGSKPYNAIDANLFVGSDGSYKLNFGSFWHGLYQAPMKSPPKTASAASTNIAYQPAGDHAIEAAYMIFKDNYYYLFFSAGVCCGYDNNRPAAGAEYKVKVCRSSSSTSGFVDKSGVSCLNGGGTVVLESHGNVYGPGGASVYNDPGMGWVLVYHHVDTTIGYADGDKRFGVNKLVWSGGWPTV